MKKAIFVVVSVLLAQFFGCGEEPTEPVNLPLSTEHKKVVAMKDNIFDPASLTITVGDTVVWVNQGSIAHTSTSGQGCTKDGKWDSGFLASGQSFTYIFPDSGTYPYFCIPHCLIGMTGTIVVNP